MDLGGLTGQFWSTLVGAIVGTVVSGIISWIIQSNGADRAKEERLATKEQEDLSTAFLVTIKVVAMLSHLRGIRNQVRSFQIRQQDDECSGMEFWQVMPPFGTLPAVVQLTDPERSLVFSLADHSLTLDLFELPDIHNDLIELAKQYSDKRIELTSAFKPHKIESATHASTDLEPDEVLALTPKIIGVRSLVDALQARVEGDSAQADAVFEKLQKCFAARFVGKLPKLEISRTEVT